MRTVDYLDNPYPFHINPYGKIGEKSHSAKGKWNRGIIPLSHGKITQRVARARYHGFVDKLEGFITGNKIEFDYDDMCKRYMALQDKWDL